MDFATKLYINSGLCFPRLYNPWLYIIGTLFEILSFTLIVLICYFSNLFVQILRKMGLGIETKENLNICLAAIDELDGFCKRLEEKIAEEQQQVKACKKNTELELKLAQEMKLHHELNEHLSKLTDRSAELDRVCASFETHLTITDSDRNRLDNAKETYEIEKEITGIRFDFSAQPSIAKGYVKSESRKLLQPFEVPATDSEALWALIQATAAPGWPHLADKENLPNNNH